MFIINLILFILVLGIIILIHELGHFFFAKKAGILCHEFAIGMGPVIYQKRKGETMYSIRGIPIGGYVSMAGESISDALIKKGQIIGFKLNEQGVISDIVLNDQLPFDQKGIVVSYDLYGKAYDPLYIVIEVDGITTRYSVLRDAKYQISEKQTMWITPSEKSFESKTLLQRFLVIFAGPFMNFVLALGLFIIISFFVMKPNLDSNEINAVAEGSPGASIGLRAGDQITGINGIAIDSWTMLSQTMAALNSPQLSLLYTREGTETLETIVVVTQIQTAGITNRSETGTIYYEDPIIGFAYGRASADGKLAAGDLIISLQIENGTARMINNWDDILDFFRTYDRGTVTVNYIRDNVSQSTTYDLISKSALNTLGYPDINFQIGIVATELFDWGYTLSFPFVSVYRNTSQVLSTIGLLFNPSEDLGIRDLSGPVGIFSLVSNTRSQGLLAILSFTAFLSINIGLLNLLPIPALDGGRLVFLGIEAVTRKRLNRKFENSVNNLMFILLLGLFIFVTFNDILRIFGG